MSIRQLDIVGHGSSVLATEHILTSSLNRDTFGVTGDFADEAIEETVSFVTQSRGVIAIHTGAYLVPGWNIIAWNLPYQQNVVDQLAAMVEYKTGEQTDITIEIVEVMKDYQGAALFPAGGFAGAAGFNGIGNGYPDRGYQIKLPGTSDTNPLIGEIVFIITDDVYGAGGAIISDIRTPSNLLHTNNRSNYQTFQDVIDRLNNVEKYENVNDSILSGWSIISTPRLTQNINIQHALETGVQTFVGLPTVDDTEDTPVYARNSFSGRVTLVHPKLIVGIDTSFTTDFFPGAVIQVFHNGIAFQQMIHSIQSDTQITCHEPHTTIAASIGITDLSLPKAFDHYYKVGTHKQVYNLLTKMILIKDYNGAAIIPYGTAENPQYFNGIGDIIPGHGYQIKMAEQVHGWDFAPDLRVDTPLIDQ